MNPTQQVIIAESYINHLSNTIKVLANNYQESIARGTGADLVSLVMNMTDTLKNLKELLLLNNNTSNPVKGVQDAFARVQQMVPPFFTQRPGPYPGYPYPRFQGHFMRPPEFTRPTSMQHQPSPFVGNDPMHPDNARPFPGMAIFREKGLMIEDGFRVFQESLIRDRDDAEYMFMYRTVKSNPFSPETFAIIRSHKVSKLEMLSIANEIGQIITSGDEVVFFDASQKVYVPIHFLHGHILARSETPSSSSTEPVTKQYVDGTVASQAEGAVAKPTPIKLSREPIPLGNGNVTLQDMVAYAKSCGPVKFNLKLEIYVPPGENFVIFKNLGKSQDGNLQLGDLVHLALGGNNITRELMNRHVAFAYSADNTKVRGFYTSSEHIRSGVDYNNFITAYIDGAAEILKWIEHPFSSLNGVLNSADKQDQPAEKGSPADQASTPPPDAS